MPGWRLPASPGLELSGELKGYLAKPKGAGKLPAVIVIHENRGLNPHIEDIVRRLALEGFLALGPDLLSPLGGTPSDEDQARTLIGQLDSKQTVDNLVRTVSFLEEHAGSTGKVGTVGFCWGGGMVGSLATASPDLDAGVVFYGRTPPLDDVPKIRAKLLLNYAGLDDRINEGIPAFEAALKKANVAHTVTSTKAPTTPSTTIPTLRATTRRRLNWHGTGPPNS